jgi:hypothetical protein
MFNKDNMYILTREELKNKGSDNFKNGDVVMCEKYHIHIKYGNYKHASLLTRVNTRYDMKDLPMSKHPQYIRDFIENYNIQALSAEN